MKSNVELERAFDEDGIPTDPQLTNEYYNNFNDFENDSSPERKPSMNTLTNKSITRNSMSKTIAPRRRVTTAGVVRRPLANKYVASTSNFQQQQQKSQLTHSTSSNNIRPSRAGNDNLTASKTYSGIQPRQSKAAQLEYEQLIALTNSKPDRNLFISIKNTKTIIK